MLRLPPFLHFCLPWPFQSPVHVYIVSTLCPRACTTSGLFPGQVSALLPTRVKLCFPSVHSVLQTVYRILSLWS